MRNRLSKAYRLLSPSEWEHVFALIDGNAESTRASTASDNRRRMQAFRDLALKDEGKVESAKEISIWKTKKPAGTKGLLTEDELRCLLSEGQ
jgi:hypothetical protein